MIVAGFAFTPAPPFFPFPFTLPELLYPFSDFGADRNGEGPLSTFLLSLLFAHFTASAQLDWESVVFWTG